MAIATIAASAGRWLLGAVKGAPKWAVEHPWAVATIVFAVMWMIARGNLSDERETSSKLRVEKAAEVAAHVQTKKTYREAQAAAQRLEAKRLARVTAQQQEITDEVVADYRRRIADARAHAERLREQARARAAGSPGAVGVPGAGDAAGGADQAAGDRRLPELTDAELEWRLIATEQAIQLDELINWTLRQAGVEVNPKGPDE